MSYLDWENDLNSSAEKALDWALRSKMILLHEKMEYRELVLSLLIAQSCGRNGVPENPAVRRLLVFAGVKHAGEESFKRYGF